MNLLERLRLPSPRPRAVRFSVEKHADLAWVVRDGSTPIAAIVRDTGTGGALLEVLQFSPDTPALPLAFPKHQYHYATRMGYGATFNWSVDHMFQSPDAEDSLTLVEQSDAQLVFVHRGRFNDGMTLAARLQISWDPAIAQYAYDLSWEIHPTRDCGGEFCNLFMRNLMHSDMTVREFDHGCYVRAGGANGGGGAWEKYPITVMVTGVQQHLLSGIPVPVGGGAGFIGRRGVAPMLVHRDSNVPVACGSCNVCFDLHQYAEVRAGQVARFSSRFVDAGPVVRAASSEIRTIDCGDARAHPFEPGRVCDFESTISANEPWAGGIWWCDGKTSEVVADGHAHSGTRSLRLRSESGEPVSVAPYFTSMTVENDRDYELTAWVRAEADSANAPVEAAIELRAFQYTTNLPAAVATSSVVSTKSRDWTQLKVQLNSGMVEFAMPSLTLKGKGRAWFDEILLRAV